MKFFTILFMLFSTSLFSMNTHVGERANFTIKNSGVTGLLKYEVLSLDRANASYKVETQIISNGTIYSDIETLHYDDIMTHTKAELILNKCFDIGGVLNAIAVNGKLYNTCKLPISNMLLMSMVPSFLYKEIIGGEGFAWFGDFPIWGVGKIDVLLGTKMRMTGMHWNR